MRVLIFIVAYNAERTIQQVVARIPEILAQYDTEILIIDDSSHDQTFSKAHDLRIRGNSRFPTTVLFNPVNQGYGGNQKIGFHYAIQNGFDALFVTAAELIDDLVRLAAETNAEIVLPWDGRSHYLAAVYRTDLAERISGLVAAGARSMRALIDASDAQQLVLPESRFLANVNTESDLLALAQSRG